MSNVDLFTLNTFEGVFWAALSFVGAFFIAKGIPDQYRFLGFYTAFTLLIFGVADFIENFVQATLHAHAWLFIGKAICVLALSIAVIWYIKISQRNV